ncbi:MAG: NAD-dependent epimerase/dehydratase family protein [Magnetococcales bacterium]|nr:NAD-dependent epimerase/dehydratase family protein [Magnetococcales bacterium]
MEESPFATLLKPDLDAILERCAPLWEKLRHGRLFLTGCSGFFGAWLLASLVRANRDLGLQCKAVILSRNPTHFLNDFPELANDPHLEFLTGDVRHFTYPKGSFTHAIHAATDTSQTADKNPLLLLDTLLEGTKRVLQFCGTAGVKDFLFISSGAVYGSQAGGAGGLVENCLYAPPPEDGRASYGIGKRMAEHYCTLYGQRYNMAVKVARCFAFVGPFMPMQGHFAIGNFISDALFADKITIAGDGSPVRTYLYAGDLVVWLWHILLQGQGAYNVGSDEAITIRQLAELTVRQIAPDKEVCILGKGSARNVYLPDIQKARSELGLDVFSDLSTAIGKTAQWYSQWAKREAVETKVVAPKEKLLTLVVDIDGVVATLTPGNDYALAEPQPVTIEAINRLYRAGHRVILFTARGSATGLDWQEVTRQQMQRWGVCYHELRFGKPAADYYVDDRLISPAALAELAGLGSSFSHSADPLVVSVKEKDSP